MIAILGMLSFFLLLLTIINIIKKNPVKPYAICLGICLIILLIFQPLTQENENKDYKVDEITKQEDTKINEKPVDEQKNKKEMEDVKVLEYDNLQKVFLSITKDTTDKDVLLLANEYGLKYKVQSYNGTPKTRQYKIAYDSSVALHRYADSGDYLEISFSKENNSLMNARYFNLASFKNAIYYNYGSYWDFDEKTPNNSYTGYYYNTPGESKGGITIKYNNGNSKETGYHGVNTAEEALQKVLK